MLVATLPVLLLSSLLLNKVNKSPPCTCRIHDDLTKLFTDHPILQQELRPRSRLKPKHAAFFDQNYNNQNNNYNKNSSNGKTLRRESSSMFNQLGRMICATGVVSLKEFLETYAVATYIHHYYFSSGDDDDDSPQEEEERLYRMADLAAGHGLLGWFLLALEQMSSDYNNSTSRRRRPTTVICIDPRRPRASYRISEIMMMNMMKDQDKEEENVDEFALSVDEEESQGALGFFTYVTADLKSIQPHPSCLLASVHACGILTDHIIQLAIQHSTPLAVVPCCHSVKQQSWNENENENDGVGMMLTTTQQQRILLQEIVEERKAKQPHDKHQAVADVIDEIRCGALRDAGYTVKEILLPDICTGRNRLILADPPPPPPTTTTTTTTRIPKQQQQQQQQQRQDVAFSNKNSPRRHHHNNHRRGMPPLPLPQQRGGRVLLLPLADDPKSIAYCQSVSMNQRQQLDQQQQQKQKQQTTQSSIPTINSSSHKPTKQLSLTLHLCLWITTTSSTTTPTTKLNNEETIMIVQQELQSIADECCRKQQQHSQDDDGLLLECKVKTFGSDSDETILKEDESSTSHPKEAQGSKQQQKVRVSQMYSFCYTNAAKGGGGEDGSWNSKLKGTKARGMARTIHNQIRNRLSSSMAKEEEEEGENRGNSDDDSNVLQKNNVIYSLRR